VHVLPAASEVVVDGEFVDQRQVLVGGVDAARTRIGAAARLIRLAVQARGP
jgi:hypothetical protein